MAAGTNMVFVFHGMRSDEVAACSAGTSAHRPTGFGGIGWRVELGRSCHFGPARPARRLASKCLRRAKGLWVQPCSQSPPTLSEPSKANEYRAELRGCPTFVGGGNGRLPYLPWHMRHPLGERPRCLGALCCATTRGPLPRRR